MKTRTRVALLLLVCLLGPAAQEVRATSASRHDFAWIVDRSDLILVGVVRQSNTRADSWPDPEELYTYYELEIERLLKGTPPEGNEFWIRVYGANFGGGAFAGFAGTPWLTDGERYLLFVVGNGTYGVPFADTRVIRVIAHPTTGEDVLATQDGSAIGGFSTEAGGRWEILPENLDEPAPPDALPRLVMARPAADVLDELAAFIETRPKTATPGIPTAESVPPPDHLMDLDAEFQHRYRTPETAVHRARGWISGNRSVISGPAAGGPD